MEPVPVRRRAGMWAAAVLAVAVTTLVGCSGSEAGLPESLESPPRGEGDASADGGSCAPEGAEAPAKALVRCSEGTIGYVETTWASGTGVAVEVAGATYVLTNLHVVDPFRGAGGTFGHVTLEDVPLAGADVAADIALLGPLEGEQPVLAISTGEDLEKGDEVFAVGYPGETSSDDVEPTVTSGIVSRLREVPEWDQTYVQTDARIVEGQSGGPLFDDGGRLVGITGLGFEDDNFGLALLGADVLDAAEGVADGEGDDLVTVPLSADPVGGAAPEGGATSGTAQLTDAADGATLYLPPSVDDRTLNLSVPDAAAGVVVLLSDAATFEPLVASASTTAAVDALTAKVSAAGGDDLDDVRDELVEVFGDPGELSGGTETAPGTFQLDVPSGTDVEILVTAPLATTTTSVAWTSDLELWPLSGPIDTVEARPGDRVTGTFLTYDAVGDVAVPLQAGQEVEVLASTPQGDVDVTVIPPGATVDPVAAWDPELAGFEVFRDSGTGLYGLDVAEPFTAEDEGTYTFRVQSFDGVPVAWAFEVAPA